MSTERDTVYRWLDESDAYSKIDETVVEAIHDGNERAVHAPSLPIEDPQIQKVFSSAFTPEFSKTAAVDIIDGTYNWLDGRSETPDFNVDVTSVRERLADGLGDYAVQRMKGLPMCTPEQLLFEGISFLEATCRPPLVTDGIVKALVAREVRTSDKFFGGENTLTGADVTQDIDPQTMEGARQSYQATKWAPWVTGFVVLATAIGVVLLSTSRRRGGRRLGGIVISGGVVIGIVTVGAHYASKFVAASGEVNSLAAGLISVAGQDAVQMLAVWAGVYIVAGIVAIVVLRQRRKQPPVQPVAEEEATTSASL